MMKLLNKSNDRSTRKTFYIIIYFVKSIKVLEVRIRFYFSNGLVSSIIKETMNVKFASVQVVV